MAIPIRDLYIKHALSNKLIPNQPRFISNDKLDSKLFFPHHDIYPSINPNSTELMLLPELWYKQQSDLGEDVWFERKLLHDRLEYAIKYLQTDRLNEIIQINDISIISTLFVNPFECMLNCIYPFEYNINGYCEI